MSVTVASTMNGEKTSTGNHIGHVLLLPAEHAYGGGQKAQRHGAGVAHEDARLGEVPDQETSGSSGNGGTDDRKLELSALMGGNGIGAETEERHAACKPVRSVHEIVEIGHPHNGEQGEGQKQRWPLVGKRQNAAATSACAARRGRTESPRLSSRNEMLERMPSRRDGGDVAAGTNRSHVTNAAAMIPRPPVLGVGTLCDERFVGNVDDGAKEAVADKQAHENGG